VALKKVPNFA